jgi:uncharacterized protein YjbI with pentapeptide repeats
MSHQYDSVLKKANLAGKALDKANLKGYSR